MKISGDQLLGSVLITCCLLAMPACRRKAPAPPPPPPPAVVVGQVIQQTVPIFVENVGHTEAASTVEIRARVQGFLTEAPFKEGTMVKKGDLLFQIDPKPFEAAVEQAKADVAKKDATLALAKLDEGRLTKLVDQNTAAQQEKDNAVAKRKVAEGDLMASKAAQTTAELNLGYTRMTAPFDGMIGGRLVDVGNFVGSSADTVLLATISTTNPMRAIFNVAEQKYLRFQKRFMGDEAEKEKHSAAMDFQLTLSDGTRYEHNGKYEYAERALDARAGTIKIVVSFPNPTGLLRPGQFCRVRVKPEERPNAILVPQKAVTKTQNLQMVMVVGADNKIVPRPVTLLDRYEEYFIVESGVKAGEKVVVEGLQKVRPGMLVNPHDQPAKAPPPGAPVTPPAPPTPAPAAPDAKATAPAAKPEPAR